MSELEKLPRLLQRAIATLDKATTSAEILEAKTQAGAAYDAAKIAAHLAKIKGAHQDVMASIYKVQAEALAIDARAKIRLADEYDAAQKRGEVHRQGQGEKRNIPKGNVSPTVKDIGLTSKQIHEARAVRDAEEKKPGAIRKMLDAKLEAGEEPTRADVKRTVNEVTSKSQKASPKKPTSPPKPHATHNAIVAAAATGKSQKEIALDLGVNQRVVRRELESEAIARKAKADPNIDPATLSMTAQEKLQAAIRQSKQKLVQEFEMRVLEECKRRLNEISLPAYAKQLQELERAISNRKGVMDRITYKKILACLHPDRVHDEVLKKRYEEAFRLFTELEKRVLDEKESPTEFRRMPKTYEELMAMKAKVQADKRAKRAAKSNNIMHR